jgi:hypothetical protein
VPEVNIAATGLNLGRRLPAWTRRPRALASSGPTDTSPAPAKWILAASRLIFVFTVFATAAMLVSAAIGYGLARQNDARLASEQHSALRNAIAEFRSPFNASGEISPGLVRVAENVAGVKNLKFERDTDAGEREMRPVMAGARIAGFFHLGQNQSHDARHGATGFILRRYCCRAFRLCRVVSVATQAGTARIGGREVQAARAADEDKLTGLSNHGKTLELLDLALAERRDEDWTTFALIELDGLEDRYRASRRDGQ